MRSAPQRRPPAADAARPPAMRRPHAPAGAAPADALADVPMAGAAPPGAAEPPSSRTLPIRRRHGDDPLLNETFAPQRRPRTLPKATLRRSRRRSAAARLATRHDHRLALRRWLARLRMTVKSMTGFARADGANGATPLALGGRASTAGPRGSLRLPPGFEAAGAQARPLRPGALERGNLQRRPDVEREAARLAIRAQRGCADARRSPLADRAQAQHRRVAPPTLDGLLAMQGRARGGRDRGERGGAARLDGGLLAGLANALDGSSHARRARARGFARITAGSARPDREPWSSAAANPGARSPRRSAQRLRSRSARLSRPRRPRSSGCTRRRSCSPPRPTSRRTRPARRPYRGGARAARAGGRSAAGSISWPRSSTARPTRCAPRSNDVEIEPAPAWS